MTATPPTTTARAPRRTVLIAYGVLIAIGAAFAVGAAVSYPLLLENSQVGPGLMPLVAGSALVLVGLLLVRQELTTGSVLEGDGAAVDTSGEDIAKRRRTHRKLLSVMGLTVVAAALIPVLGLLPVMSMLVFVLSVFVERRPWWQALLVAIAAFVVAYVIFVAVLMTPLPFGIFNPDVWSRL
ncbi:tripartite tricarboxylate transporter TctB family protein [Mycetocola reblochoni]|uniref:Tricarboxylate transport protein TctB n=2 Tax=Mycetocola reblochoni TaxID=331618 RepID=A0A1R4K9N6_9MICO|nr:tripartite tricarboxylate transporter TctB family protein [Mycetocola reblochoni]RLP71165.1 tripartite tricarboxylate transporter TctB family protein [Mycetocola reblochoni]SJN41009.1 Tricarboxylate transport protein TctB [Mycetocola reblochoni REB411]